MGRRAVTQALYENLLSAFREQERTASADGVSYAAAARDAACDRRTAERAFLLGWPRKGMTAIRDVLIQEHLAVRARLQAAAVAREQAREREATAAREQALAARVQEGQMVIIARGSSMQALAMANHLLHGAHALATKVRAVLEAEAATGGVSAPATVNLLMKVAGIAERINRAAHLSMVMERLHLGKPTDIIGVTELDDGMTLEDAEARLASAQAAIAAARRQDVRLTVLPGGGGGAKAAGDG